MSKRPNILLIMTDQQRWDTLGCYGNKTIETANLDWLAAEGTVFNKAYSCTPSCVPARASLMTEWTHGIPEFLGWVVVRADEMLGAYVGGAIGRSWLPHARDRKNAF